jgi:hypothetical protein
VGVATETEETEEVYRAVSQALRRKAVPPLQRRPETAGRRVCGVQGAGQDRRRNRRLSATPGAEVPGAGLCRELAAEAEYVRRGLCKSMSFPMTIRVACTIAIRRHPSNMGPPLPEKLRGTCATLGALSIFTFILRCYVRIRLVKSWGLDDTFISMAFVSLFPFSTAYIDVLTTP